MKPGYFLTKLMIENCRALVTPLPGGSYIQKLTEVVGLAQVSVDVIQYQWCWYPFQPENPLQKFNQVVCGTSRRGVKFRVLLNVEAIDHRITGVNQRAKRNLESAGAAVKFGLRFPITHAKLFLVDTDIIVLGSHNLSSRSVTANDESSALIKSKGVATEFKRYFNALWARS